MIKRITEVQGMATADVGPETKDKKDGNISKNLEENSAKEEPDNKEINPEQIFKRKELKNTVDVIVVTRKASHVFNHV